MNATKFSLITCAIALVLLFSNCTAINRNMREPNTIVELEKSDFELSDQLLGSSKVVKIIGIDWSRLFKKEQAKVITAPLIGFRNTVGKAESYALYDLFNSNFGYDVIFYPSFEKKNINILGLYAKTEVTVRARLAKLKK